MVAERRTVHGMKLCLDIGEDWLWNSASVSVLVLTVKGAVAPGKPSVYFFGLFVPFHACFA